MLLLLDTVQPTTFRLDLGNIVPSSDTLKKLAGKVDAIAISASDEYWTGAFLRTDDIRHRDFDSSTKTAIMTLLKRRCAYLDLSDAGIEITWADARMLWSVSIPSVFISNN